MYEPERRDWGPGYRNEYLYDEDAEAYEAGYRYPEEHGEQWQGYEPERRDFGWHHAPGYERFEEQRAEGMAPEEWMRPGPHAGKGPSGYRRSDEDIFEDACERLTRHGYVDASNIELEVDNNEITLRGTAADRREKRLAEDAVLSIHGVWDVHNRLTIPRREGGEEPSE